MSETTTSLQLSPEMPEAVYTADHDYLSVLSEELIYSPESKGTSRFACFRMNGSQEAANLGRSVELGVFLKKFGNTAEQMQEEYGPYEHDSEFLVVMDREELRTAGALRVIKNGHNGLKTLNDIAGQPLEVPIEEFQAFHTVPNLDTCIDVGTVVVPEEYRPIGNMLVSSMLYRGMHISAVEEGIEHYVSIIDVPVLDKLKMVGIPFVPINNTLPFEYLGSKKSQAVYGHTPDFIPAVTENMRKQRFTLRGRILSRYASRLTTGAEVDDSLMFQH